MTFYEILGVPRNASQEEIRSAYRALARRYHPDGLSGTNGKEREEAEEKLKAINAAFHTLSDPRRRTAYHAVMWTRHDPARQYRIFSPDVETYQDVKPGGYTNGGPKTRPASAETNLLYLELLKLKQERQGLIERQAVKHRRFWMSAGFTSLIVYFLIALGTQMYASVTDLFPLAIFFVGVELITISIILNASGMHFERFPFLGNPVAFAVTVTLGAIVACGAIPRIEMGLSVPSSLYNGSVISAALLIHLYLATRLGKIQDQNFDLDLKIIEEKIQEIEWKMQHSNQRKTRV